jgi:NlpC/P60 family putative phage cell wall peptidase
MIELVVAESRSWIGTPYRHQHSVKGAGCDCLGLLRGVWRSVHGSEPVAVPNYSPMWGEVGDEEPMLDAAHQWLTPCTDIHPGAVLMFRMKRRSIVKHCGIAVAPGRMVHAASEVGVVEVPLDDFWMKRIAGRFDF